MNFNFGGKTMNDRNATIEAAYLSGFEPSTDSLTADELFNEAEAYLAHIQ